ncbi:hypothetical protein [Arenimonas oryziterrae]|uniref:Uncharacterized protein n=1 Tax=Arenimonas oryziterrae DSM 21050 = YC6267 TaxID=1121015 RepID=A0A091AS15_9GAMM|nr:hypothetical protein [Arenimonas oryziterrae]KFN42958.1 hypothetical protein N789_12605 [Arenimonas oryziterrae DSM 21050 = YC6267]
MLTLTRHHLRKIRVRSALLALAIGTMTLVWAFDRAEGIALMPAR